MKMFNFLLIVVLTVLLSCDDDSPVDTDNINNIKNPPVESYGRGIVEGVVKDGNGQALSGVRVYYGNVETITNASGYYKIDRLSHGTNKRVWFEKEGYVSIQKLVQAKDWNIFYCDVTLLKIAKTVKLNNDGGKIEGENFSIEFPPGIFVDSKGLLIVGDVTVNATPFLTELDGYKEALPGQFYNYKEGHRLDYFISYGFIDLEILQGENEIFFKEGMTAKISIKAPKNVPIDISLGSYDENEGIWFKGNNGAISNGYLRGEIEKPSQWTWAETFDETNLSIYIIKCNNSDRVSLDGVYIEVINLENQYKYCTLRGIDSRLVLKKDEKHLIRIKKKYYKTHEFEITLNESNSNFNDICLELSDESKIMPLLRDKYDYRLTPGEKSHIYGEYLGDDKSQLELFIDGNSVDFNLVYDRLYNYHKKSFIEFIVPNNISLEGEMQLRRGTQLSNKVNYIKTEEKWTIYNPENCVIPSRLYSSIIESKDKTIWVGTYGGIGHFDGTNWESIQTTELGYYFDDGILSLTETRDGTLWFGCGLEGSKWVLKYDGINSRIFDDKAIPLPYSIAVIIEDNKNVIWFGGGGGLVTYKNEKWSTPIGTEKMNSSRVNSIIELDNGDMWIGTDRGIYFYDGNTFTQIEVSNYNLSEFNEITTMNINSNGDLLVGTIHNGILLYNGSNWTEFNTFNSGLPQNYIRKIKEDSNGNLWIGTIDYASNSGALTKFDGKNWTIYNMDNSKLPHYFISDIMESSDGKLWIATSNGLAVLENY